MTPEEIPEKWIEVMEFDADEFRLQEGKRINPAYVSFLEERCKEQAEQIVSIHGRVSNKPKIFTAQENQEWCAIVLQSEAYLKSRR